MGVKGRKWNLAGGQVGLLWRGKRAPTALGINKTLEFSDGRRQNQNIWVNTRVVGFEYLKITHKLIYY